MVFKSALKLTFDNLAPIKIYILAKEIDEIKALVEELEESFDHKQAEQQKEDNGLISLEKRCFQWLKTTFLQFKRHVGDM